MLLETHMKLCVTEFNHLQKKKFSKKKGNWAKNRLKMEFFEFIEKFQHELFLDLDYEILC